MELMTSMLDFLPEVKRKTLLEYDFIKDYLTGVDKRSLFLENLKEFEAELLSRNITPYELDALRNYNKNFDIYIQRVRADEVPMEHRQSPGNQFLENIHFIYKWHVKNLDGYVTFELYTTHRLNPSDFPFCSELLTGLLDKSPNDKILIFKRLDNVFYLLIRGYVKILLKYPYIKHYKNIFFMINMDNKKGYLLAGLGGYLLNFNYVWIEWLLEDIHKNDKKRLIKDMDYFGHSVIHELTHLFDEGKTVPLTQEGISRFIEFMVGNYLFNAFGRDIQQILGILDNSEKEKPENWPYFVGLYIFLVIYVERLSRSEQFHIPMIYDFSSYPLEEKITILSNIKKILKKAGLLKSAVEFAEDFRKEMQTKNYEEIYQLFRNAENNLGFQKTLPSTYLQS